jgi:UDP-N-acetylmuramoyl-tripeptide--D-alanyl-D-alanine ligase
MITLEEAQQASGGRWLRCPYPLDTPLHAGAFDTRALGDADIFFALAGEKSDGHRYLPALAGTAVKLAVVSEKAAEFDGALLQVPDTRQALARLARYLVDKHRPWIVAITASYGKTTAKEIVAHVLEGGRRLLKTPGSFNNEIGVPLTLLRLDGSQEAVVLEFAARHPGDIAQLGAIAPPDVAVLLNVGRAHIGLFGSLENTYRAKGEIFAQLRPGGLAIVGAEDPRLRALAEGHRRMTIGRDAGDFRAEQVTVDELGRQRFVAVHGEARLCLRATLPGPHGLYPLLAAWAVAREAGLPDALVAERAEHHPGAKGRAVLISAPGGATVIDDTYNASPETVVNLIRTLASLGAPEKVLVLGHLSELEEGLGDSLPLIAPHLRPPLAELWVHDPERPESAAQYRALARGIAVRDHPRWDGLIAALRSRDRPGVAFGIKGSRAAHMERAVQGLLGVEVACHLSTCGLLMHCTDCEALTRP